PVRRRRKGPRRAQDREALPRRRARQRDRDPPIQVDGDRSGGREPPQLRLVLHQPDHSRRRAGRRGVARRRPDDAALALPTGQVKLSAAWLIERAGFTRGRAEGPVGLSTKHALAIVAHDGARAGDVVAFARRVQSAVVERFGVRLTPEPVFWGLPAL